MSSYVPILAYHFTGMPLDEEDTPYTVSVEAFDQQMHYLTKEGYQCISLSDLRCSQVRDKRYPDRAVVITFDDGRSCVYREAFPILKKYGMTATVFLIASRVGHGNFLDRNQILEMAEHGIAFESHGVTHRRLSSLTDNDLMEEALQSRNQLESLLCRPVRFFAYPYGDYSPEAQQALKASGYYGAVCSKPGHATEFSDSFALPRMGIRRKDTIDIFHQKLNGNRTVLAGHNTDRLRRRLTVMASVIAGAFKK